MIARALALLTLLPFAAHAADMSIHANRMSAMALQRLIGVPFVDVARAIPIGKHCGLLADEEPPMVLSEEQQPLVTGMPTPPTRPEPVQGSVPATDPADAPVDAPVAPKTKATKSAGADQPLCTSHGMQTIYTGKHWRCRK